MPESSMQHSARGKTLFGSSKELASAGFEACRSTLKHHPPRKSARGAATDCEVTIGDYRVWRGVVETKEARRSTGWKRSLQPRMPRDDDDDDDDDAIGLDGRCTRGTMQQTTISTDQSRAGRPEASERRMANREDGRKLKRRD